jgi:hypothetical protein
MVICSWVVAAASLMVNPFYTKKNGETHHPGTAIRHVFEIFRYSTIHMFQGSPHAEQD